MMSYFGIGWSDMDEVWQLYAEYHADYGDVVKVEPEEEFQYGGRLFLQNGNSYISTVD